MLGTRLTSHTLTVDVQYLLCELKNVASNINFFCCRVRFGRHGDPTEPVNILH